ncbi:hypothetical protein BV22DRAFT_1135542 [Leucogyrophana mollusca]|uniref:Uncharacterized protein n=1 Tax=Leucogyrophana mollusca TaxID=85980 RepID=A0ACB8AVS3_9AGAM|nr:hypothetical protein BV22DRAFT_1135542 [Leucogyrophana mollusca]
MHRVIPDSHAPAVTISGDSTSLRNVNYESRMVELKARSYGQGDSASHKRCARVVSVASSANHTHESQIEGWKEEISHLSSTFSQSPLAQRTELSLDVNEFLIKLKGMHSDHASNQKKTYRLWQEWKHRVICASYGFDRIEKMKLDATNELCSMLLQATAEVIIQVGGTEKWDSMDIASRQPHITEMMEGLAYTIGAGIVASLPEDERRSVELGNVAMMKWWAENGIPPPELLANKDNAATIQLAEIVDASAAAVKRAFEVSSRGGVKAANLAGAIFNHKDDKKGQQDTHRFFFMQVKGKVKNALKKFPDTSNTRYHSHCDAATELIKYLDHYLEFLDFIRDNKTNPQLNHMEENLAKALRDAATLTELAVLTLYSQAVTKPYMRMVCAPGTDDLNILNLGSLPEDLKCHIATVITSPSLLLSGEPQSYLSATFDKQPWDDPLAVQTVIEMYKVGKLPHLENVLIAFLKGAHETWQRFTEEFAAGGLIATSSAEECELAAMPTTNDANEGMLGTLRRSSREKPSLTVGHFSDQAAFFRNDTQEFMDDIFIDEDHAHLRKEARMVDASGIERQRRDALIEHGKKVAKETRQKAEDRRTSQAKIDAHFSQLNIITDRTTINKMLVEALKDQLELHRRLDVEKTIPLKSHLKTKKERLHVLLLVIDRYEARKRGET